MECDFMYYKKAKQISFSRQKRNKKDVKYIVIHFTGNKKDTAKNNVDFFAKNNTREAGAHFFVSANGEYAKSIPMNRSAWAVGGVFDKNAKYLNKCTNFNSVSIELCDAVDGWTVGHVTGAKKVIKYIRKYCPNAKAIICHHDVNGKNCPNWWKRFNSFKKLLEVK